MKIKNMCVGVLMSSMLFITDSGAVRMLTECDAGEFGTGYMVGDECWPTWRFLDEGADCADILDEPAWSGILNNPVNIASDCVLTVPLLQGSYTRVGYVLNDGSKPEGVWEHMSMTHYDCPYGSYCPGGDSVLLTYGEVHGNATEPSEVKFWGEFGIYPCPELDCVNGECASPNTNISEATSVSECYIEDYGYGQYSDDTGVFEIYGVCDY